MKLIRMVSRAGVGLLALALLGTGAVRAQNEPKKEGAPPVVKKANSKRSGGKAKLEGKININTATATDLQKLPGVGEAIAERILAFRKEKGKFSDIAQLTEVKGIGEKKLEKLRPFVSLN